jgi:hypothetical protein
MESGGIAPRIPVLSTKWELSTLRPDRFNSEKGTTVPTAYGAVWAPDSVSTFRRVERNISSGIVLLSFRALHSQNTDTAIPVPRPEAFHYAETDVWEAARSQNLALHHSCTQR